MRRKTLVPKLILMIIASGFLLTSQPIKAESTPTSELVGNQKTAERDDLKDASIGQIGVQFSQDEFDSIAAALPEGEVRQMFTKKVATGAEKDNASSDEGRTTDPLERVRSGEEYSRIFFEGEKAFSQVQEQIYAFF